MNNLIAITAKETKAYFAMPSAYVVGAMFLVLTGVFFVFDISSPFAEAGVRGLVDWASFFTIFLAPLLTMRLLAEEQKLGTLELLLTSPVREWEVVLGKYIASLAMLLAIQFVTLYYVLMIYVFGDPDSGPVLSSYLGLILHGAAALAIGILGSSLSANQIVAAVVGTAVLLFFTFIDRVSSLVAGGTWWIPKCHLNGWTPLRLYQRSDRYQSRYLLPKLNSHICISYNPVFRDPKVALDGSPT